MEAGAPIPAWAVRGEVFCVMRAHDELSIVCAEDHVPSDKVAGITAERGWRALRLHGPFPFGMTGILASVLNPLAAAGVGIFALSTYNTDYVLVKADQLGRALDALRGAGHTVHG